MVIDRHIRCIRVVNNNRYMYRKTSSTYAHSYKILLFDSQNFTFLQTHTHSPQNGAHAFECRARSCIRGIWHLSFTSKDECLITLHYRERRKHFIIPLICAYNNRVGNSFTPATDAICRLPEEALDRSHKRNSSDLQFLSQE